MLSAGDVMTLLGALAIIILMLVGTYYATRWYARRSGGTIGGMGKYIKVIDRAQMGAASLLIVEIEGDYYLVGLSDKNMQLITKLEGFTPQEPEAPKTPSFGKILGDMLKKNKQNQDGDSGGDI